jgi:6-phosphogluconolactonase
MERGGIRVKSELRMNMIPSPTGLALAWTKKGASVDAVATQRLMPHTFSRLATSQTFCMGYVVTAGPCRANPLSRSLVHPVAGRGPASGARRRPTTACATPEAPLTHYCFKLLIFRLTLFVLSAVIIQAAQSEGAAVIAKNATLVYVGSRTEMKGKGIYLFRLQPQGSEVFQNVTLVPLGIAAETENPTFIETDPKRRLLFAVNEVENGAVSSFSIDPAGKLTLLNKRPSMGSKPCHLALDKDAKNLLVAHCGSNTVTALPVAPDGRLGEPAAVLGNAGRSIALDPASRFAFACDPASDKILSYRFDAESGQLTPNEPAAITVRSGSFRYDSASGKLSEMDSVRSVPEYFDGQNTAIAVGMHRTGKYLYVSNHGHNSVVLFTIDADKGNLTFVEEQGTGGKNPGHFGIEPSAKHMAIANQDSHTVLASRIDETNGRLKPSGIFAEVPAPAFVEFLPPVEAAK